VNLIKRFWATFGAILAILILVFVEKHLSVKTLCYIHFSTLLLHQFEEYVFPGNFKGFYNTHIYKKTKITSFFLNDSGVLMVNIVLGWIMYILAIFLSEKALWFSMGLAGISILNGIMHTAMFIRLKAYNPGLITSLLVLIPFGLFFLDILFDAVGSTEIILGFAVFVFGALLIPTCIYLSKGKG
jgi:hypothetical protein